MVTMLMVMSMVSTSSKLVIRDKTKVSYLDDPVGGEINIRRLQISVNKVLTVNVFYPRTYLTKNIVNLVFVSDSVQSQPVSQGFLKSGKIELSK